MCCFPELLDLAERAAGELALEGVESGDRVLLVLGTSWAFLGAFFGCQLLGAIPVPVIPPTQLGRSGTNLDRIARVAERANARAVVADARSRAALCSEAFGSRCSLPRMIDAEHVERSRVRWTATPPTDPNAPALIQFTSGSTGNPKGVVLSHAAILANVHAIGAGLQMTPDDAGCTWLPLYHDMGLIGHLLCPLAWGVTSTLLTPETFVRRPLAWLEAISRFGATIAASSNYGFALCARRAMRRAPTNLDLTRWRRALCGGEPVHLETLERFVEAFRHAGFDSDRLYPVYGLAEFSLAAAFPAAAHVLRRDRVDRRAYEVSGRAIAALPGHASLDWVSVGRAVTAHELRVVDSRGCPVPDRTCGEIELRGPSRMTGYYDDPDASADAIVDGWLRTRDRGYLAEGDLFVTGRSRDLILVRGHSLHPEDIEQIAADALATRPDRCVAFGQHDREKGSQDLIVVCDAPPSVRSKRIEAARAAARAILDEVGVRPAHVLFVRAGSLPRTSSGKPRRADVQRAHSEGSLDLESPPRSRALATHRKVSDAGAHDSPSSPTTPQLSRIATDAH